MSSTSSLTLVENDRLAYSVASLAEAADCDPSTIHRAISAGSLKARKLGRKTVVLRKDAMRWLEGLPDRRTDADTREATQARKARAARRA
jgi:hypothetical protein